MAQIPERNDGGGEPQQVTEEVRELLMSLTLEQLLMGYKDELGKEGPNAAFLILTELFRRVRTDTDNERVIEGFSLIYTPLKSKTHRQPS